MKILINDQDKNPFYQASVVIPLFFFGFVTIILFSGIIREREINFDIIAGAISVYFLIGITWAYFLKPGHVSRHRNSR